MKKFLAAIAMTALAATSVNAATILVGTDAGYAPYEYKDPQTNEIVGFDIDLIKAIAKATGNEAKIQNMQFAGIIPALQSNMIDVAAAGMTITPERQKQVTFSDPYYDVGGLIMAVHAKNVDKYKHMNDLEGKRVKVNACVLKLVQLALCSQRKLKMPSLLPLTKQAKPLWN